MPWWVWMMAAVFGTLMAAKMCYVLCVALVIPKTRGALYVSSSRVRVDAFLDAVPLAPGGLLVDLGCGDGRVLRHAARRYGARCVGYELNPMALARARLASLGMQGVTLRRADFFSADISRADVVYCYLFPDVLRPLAKKLRAELAPGALAVSANFPLPGWEPERVIRPRGELHHDPIYIYRQGPPAG